MEITKAGLKDISESISAMHGWLKYLRERFPKNSWERADIDAEMKKADEIIYQLEQILDSEH